MKATLEFNLPEENEEFLIAQKGELYHAALSKTYEEVFRPARKHGYRDPVLNRLASTDNGQELVALLEVRFLEILDMYEIKGEV